MMKKLVTLFLFSSFSVIADVNVINLNTIDKYGFQVIKFRDVKNSCDYYGKTSDIKPDERIIIVTRKVCENIDSPVKLFAESNSPINLDSQWVHAGSKWTLR